MELTVLITSPPDRERLVAEIWVDDCQLAEISQEGEPQMIELYSSPQGDPWQISFDEFLATMKHASARLEQKGGA